MPFEQFLSFLHHSSGGASRSTALAPLNWLTLTLVAAVLGCLAYGNHTWICSAFFGLIALVVLCFLGVYIYLIIRNPDATRSEKFTLEKMALQQGSPMLMATKGQPIVESRDLGPGIVKPPTSEQREREAR
jgi:hypothetical protein